MARTVKQIYKNFIDEKNTYANLSTLTPGTDDLPSLLADIGSSPSTVAVWRLWVYLFAYASWSLETLWDNFIALIKSLLAAQQVPTLPWYQTKVFAFQYGDGLVQVGDQFIYPVIDATKQIVTRCSPSENNGVRLKVAKSPGGVQTQLTNGELSALNSYLSRVKPGGVNVVAVSFAADLIKCPVTVYYDPLVLDDTGQSILAPGTYPVEDAINSYIDKISGIKDPTLFDGVINLAKLEDAVQAASGVVDVVLGNVQWKYGALIYATIVRQQQTNAGWCKIDPAYPLNTTISYVANV